MAQQALLAAPSYVLYIDTPLYNGEYQPGQYEYFTSYQQLLAFVSDAPECIVLQGPFATGLGGAVSVTYVAVAGTGCVPPQAPCNCPPPPPCNCGFQPPLPSPPQPPLMPPFY